MSVGIVAAAIDVPCVVDPLAGCGMRNLDRASGIRSSGIIASGSASVVSTCRLVPYTCTVSPPLLMTLISRAVGYYRF